MKITGRVWKFGDEINTDLIFPHSAFRASPDEQCRLCMSDNRPGWSEQVQPGDILIAGKNFGTGSSRPGAAVLKRQGKLLADRGQLRLDGVLHRFAVVGFRNQFKHKKSPCRL